MLLSLAAGFAWEGVERNGEGAHPLDLEDLRGGAQFGDLLFHFLRQASHRLVQFGVVLDFGPAVNARRLLCRAQSLQPKQAPPWLTRNE
jgi:hypothetical protein